MKSPKVVVVGAGSYFFGTKVLWNMVESPVLKGGTLAYVDTNEEVLNTMLELGRRVTSETASPTRVVGSTRVEEVLDGADFVVLTYAERNAHYRGVDCEISAKHGMRMCSGDTIGPGGIFRALREVPTALGIADQVRRLAPQAWVINFVNPATVLGIAMRRFAPDVHAFSICDGLHEPYYRTNVLKNMGILPPDAKSIPPEVEAKLDLRIAGVNHCTWMTRFHFEGEDMMPKWRSWLEKEVEDEIASHNVDLSDPRFMDDNAYSKRRYNRTYALEMMKAFGAYPNRIGHHKEYVPYFQGWGVTPTYPEAVGVFDGPARQEKMDRKWQETREFASGERSVNEFMKLGSGDHATDIIESMWGGLGKRFYINTENRGAVGNMNGDACLELLCDLDMKGPRPIPVGDLPYGILGAQQQVIDTHELTAEAAATCDREILYRAMVSDPLCVNLLDAKKLMLELLEAEREAIPSDWFSRNAAS